MENGKFEEFGESFGENDVIGCFAVREWGKMGENGAKPGKNRDDWEKMWENAGKLGGNVEKLGENPGKIRENLRKMGGNLEKIR